MIVVNKNGEQHKIIDLNKDGTIAVQPVKVGGKISWRAPASEYCTLEQKKAGHVWEYGPVYENRSTVPRRRINPK